MFSIIYFSPSGNTKYLATLLQRKLNVLDSNLHTLEFTKYEDISQNDHLVLMFPVHGFNPPRTVNRFIKGLPQGLYKKISLFAVGCSDIWVNDAVSVNIKKKLIKKGYSIHLDEVLAMPLTLVMDFKNKDEVVRIAEKKLNMLTEKLKGSNPTNRKPGFASKVIHTVGKLEDPAARLFGLELHATKDCISCGICWNNCPENNIKQGKNDKPKFGFSCSMCLRCIYDCPEKAITPYISKFIPIKNGYTLFNKQKED